MKCIIIDDEPLAREGMKLNINEVSTLELVGSFENPIEANDFLNNNDVDLMFLDIEMPELTGLEFLKTLVNQPLVILTTAYPQYALESYELDVIDYLVKPIRIERFIKAVNKAEEIFKMKNTVTHEVESIGDDYIFVKSERKYVKIFFKDIKYIEGLKDYVIIHAMQRKIMTAMNVKTIDNQLPSEIFVRINKSYIINIHSISEIDNDFVIIDTNEIPIGRTYKEDFIKNYVNKRLIKR
ncbi:MAG: DNA-binding response regulator [Marinilabiliales bacterium]|nr:MAG: DNA-binding response regulator [Marinilabiliales bacterium]